MRNSGKPRPAYRHSGSGTGWPPGYQVNFTQFDAREGLAKLDVPALVVAGEFDEIFPADISRQSADLIPGAEFSVISGAGHISNVDFAEAVTLRCTSFSARALARWARCKRPNAWASRLLGGLDRRVYREQQLSIDLSRLELAVHFRRLGKRKAPLDRYMKPAVSHFLHDGVHAFAPIRRRRVELAKTETREGLGAHHQAFADVVKRRALGLADAYDVAQ